ncbi:MAG: hypothetical protein EBR22_00010 [Cytophagia bacterium]|nr:hypothetical protein [Cytophagia bacterium]
MSNTGTNPKSPSWNLWTVLDPERWVQPDAMRRHGLFGVYLIALMILYIAYIHRCENLVRNMSLLEKNNQELRSQYLFLKTELVSLGQLERVSERALSMGLEPLRVPPLALNRRAHESGKTSLGKSTTNSLSKP